MLSINIQAFEIMRGDFLLLPEEVSLIWNSVSDDFEIEYSEIPHQIYMEVTRRIPITAYWNVISVTPILKPNTEFRGLLISWISIWRFVVSSQNKNRDAELDSHFFTLFSAVEDFLVANPTTRSLKIPTGPRKTINDFYFLLTRHSKDNMEVAQYASLLGITPSYLNKLCQRVGVASPKRLIDQQALVEIKTLLSTTELPIKAIAERVNFEDTSYLCRFFRRMTGQSPQQFRESR